MDIYKFGQEAGLKKEEIDHIIEILGRKPNLVELGVYSAMWSEHCSYKSSRTVLKTYPTSGKQLVQGPGENAGIVDIGNNIGIVFKIESHNHPSYVEPVEGAATGIGGILRDIFTMGARPIALLDSLRFGDLNNSRTKFLIRGVVEGISMYGNCVGIPTVSGETEFDNSYTGNPLVNVMAVGIIDLDKVTYARAKGTGNLLVYYGSSTGRDGIHGATFASDVFGTETDSLKSNVQVGDPFTEKKILEATLELINKDLIVAAQDMGASGITSSTSEIATRGDVGVAINIDKIPVREKNITTYEIMLSESQERMLAIVHPDKLEQVTDVLNKWELHPAVIGKVIEDERFILLKNGQEEANIPVKSLTDDAPAYNREYQKPEYLNNFHKIEISDLKMQDNIIDDLKLLLEHPNVCSKKWIYNQYDYMVRNNTVVGPGIECGILRVYNTDKYITVTTDSLPDMVYRNPYNGGYYSVMKSARKTYLRGAIPVGITNCLNFASPEDPEVFYTFREAVRGIGDACRDLNIPVTGGNVSFYNESPDLKIKPTPVIGMIGVINKHKPVTAVFKNVTDKIFILGSELYPAPIQGIYLDSIQKINNGIYQKINRETEIKLFNTILEMINCNILNSTHAIGLGGIAVSIIRGLLHHELGCKINTKCIDIDDRVLLFNEYQGNVVVSIPKDKEEKFYSIADKNKLKCYYIGEITDKPKIVINNNKVDLNDLEESYNKGTYLI